MILLLPLAFFLTGTGSPVRAQAPAESCTKLPLEFPIENNKTGIETVRISKGPKFHFLDRDRKAVAVLDCAGNSAKAPKFDEPRVQRSIGGKTLLSVAMLGFDVRETMMGKVDYYMTDETPSRTVLTTVRGKGPDGEATASIVLSDGMSEEKGVLGFECSAKPRIFHARDREESSLYRLPSGDDLKSCAGKVPAALEWKPRAKMKLVPFDPAQPAPERIRGGVK